ncbi:GNAT family N-acetyltransferase [Paeniglutamicibacter kerguelensis]|uniref:RimJ/RimL family protein N-acetyltransferase n=1 Tax=Paeniglutamicibacter kerguelensis TaxID=254788 RepID=A0ABS4XJK1_9MICC|nr:GNAT family N-acetyltransferase [Paeniglutamicibacter kerguelensis]MBP2388511.1 RimJ/RimL family protein N-acetyltransferase [Paeniglutamicibacter kerguelensis]
MTVNFLPMSPADTEDVIAFLTSNGFPFHVQAEPQPQSVRAGVEGGRFWNSETQGYWVLRDGQRLGIVSLEDLQDASPLFDLRLDEAHRGRGLGVEVVRALCDLVFTTMPGVLRFEGQTREDNIAMRKTFLRCGFLKEAHYRMGWPTEDGGHVASTAYAILRQDWQHGTVTTFDWEEIHIQTS